MKARTPTPTPTATATPTPRIGGEFLPTAARNGSRRRRRTVPVPMATLSSAALFFLAISFLSKSTNCWTAPILVTKKTLSSTNRLCRIDFGDPRCGKRSADADFSSSPTIALWSMKSDADTTIRNCEGTSINGNGFDSVNQTIDYGNNNNNTDSIHLVETESEDKGAISTTGRAEAFTNRLSLTKPMVSPSASTIHEIAVVLNTNAKGVTKDLIEVARDVVAEHQQTQASENDLTSPRIRLTVTSTYEDARVASREIVAAAANANAADPTKTTMVIPVGGDGTLTAMINLLWEESVANGKQQSSISSPGSNGSTTGEIRRKNEFPFVFGYVAMGTGNALGSVVGCLPVAEGSMRRHSKRKKILRFVRKCFRPRSTTREDFRRVLTQLIEAAAQTRRRTDGWKHSNADKQVPGYGNDVAEEGSVRSEPLEVDTLELPLIRVRTTRVVAGRKRGISPANDSTNGHDGNEHVDNYAFFAGLGYDSLLLQDYKDLQDWTESRTPDGRHRWWQVATTGVAGYTLAMITRSLPKLSKLEDASVLLRDVKITTDDPRSTYWIDHRRGDAMRPALADLDESETTVGDSEEELLLYRGSAGMVAAGTVPYYGGGLRLFPFARMTPDGMHLRIARRLHPLRGISRIPWIFEGSFRDKRRDTFRCLDFVGNRFTVEIYESSSCDDRDPGESQSGGDDATEEGFPVQHSGEALGRCTRVEFAASASPSEAASFGASSSDDSGEASGGGRDPVPPPVRFLTLMPPRIVEERNGAGS